MQWEAASAQLYLRGIASTEVSASAWQSCDLYLTGRKGPFYLLFYGANAFTFVISLICDEVQLEV